MSVGQWNEIVSIALRDKIESCSLHFRAKGIDVHFTDRVSGQVNFPNKRNRRRINVRRNTQDDVPIREDLEHVREISLSHVVIPDGIGVPISKEGWNASGSYIDQFDPRVLGRTRGGIGTRDAEGRKRQRRKLSSSESEVSTSESVRAPCTECLSLGAHMVGSGRLHSGDQNRTRLKSGRGAIPRCASPIGCVRSKLDHHLSRTS